jgi:hypothetical protein
MTSGELAPGSPLPFPHFKPRLNSAHEGKENAIDKIRAEGEINMPCPKQRFSERKVRDRLITVPADVRAEIEKRLPEVSKSIGVPIQDLRRLIAGMTGGAVEEGGTENLTPEGEAEFLIYISLQTLQQFTGLDV